MGPKDGLLAAKNQWQGQGLAYALGRLAVIRWCGYLVTMEIRLKFRAKRVADVSRSLFFCGTRRGSVTVR